jgi:BirA family biotin operon repressor/biotin-[acetyl-CoA-carboxylase] ligase
MNDLTPETILAGLSATLVPRRVLCFSQVGSTMDIAREQLRLLDAADLPLLVVADEQTAGRGRLKRSWRAPAGSALLFSLALRPTWLVPMQAPMLIWMAGIALCEGIADVCGVMPRLKWPNDVMLVQDAVPHKVVGILLESGSAAHSVSWAILGCGINVAASPPVGTTRYPTTHLEAIVGDTVSRLALLQAILRRFDVWYQYLQDGRHDRLFVTWRGLLLTIGQYVNVDTVSGPVSGYAEDVEPGGALRVRDADGVVHVIASGDVGIR